MIVRVAIQIAVMCLLGWLLCDISPDKEYSWYAGIWHGLFLPANFIRNVFSGDVLYQAYEHTAAYSFFYWVFGIISVLSFFFGGVRRDY